MWHSNLRSVKHEKESKFRLQSDTEMSRFLPHLCLLFTHTHSSRPPVSVSPFCYTDKSTHAQTHTYTPSLTPPASHSLLTHTLKSYQAQLSLLRGRQEQRGSLLKELREGAAESERDIEREREGDERVKGEQSRESAVPHMLKRLRQLNKLPPLKPLDSWERQTPIP